MHKRREILILFLIQIEAGDTPKNYCDQLKSKIGFDSVCEYYGNHPIEFFKQLAHSLLKEKVQLQTIWKEVLLPLKIHLLSRRFFMPFYPPGNFFVYTSVTDITPNANCIGFSSVFW